MKRSSRLTCLSTLAGLALIPSALAQSFTEGFNNSVTNVSVSGGTYYTGNSGTGDRVASSPFAIEGTHSYGVNNGTATITSSAINTLGATGLSLSFRLASFSIASNANGADAGDIVTVAISPDNGTTWYDTVQVAGNSNAYWAYSATGSASTAYDGNTSVVTFAPAAGGQRTTDGYSTVTVTGLPQAAAMKFRITMLNNSSSERWVLDNLSFAGTFTFAPMVTTGNASAVTTTAATLGGSITASGGSDATVRGFYYSTTDGFAAGTGTAVSSSGTFSTGSFTESLTGLSPGTTYYYKAFATNSTGTGYGSQGSFSTPPVAPDAPTASLVTSGSFTASWPAVTGATSYRLDAATDSGFTTLLPAYSNLNVSGTSQALTGLDPSTTYHVRVRAVGAGGTSASSATLSQTTDVATEPALVATPASLSGYTYTYAAGPAASQPISVSGLNLTPADDSITVSATGTDYEVSTDNSSFSSTVTLPYTGGALAATTVHVRLKAGLAVGSYNAQTVSVSGGGSSTTKTVTTSGSVTIATPPTLTAAASASVDAPFDVTFTDNATWRGNITGVTVNGTPLTAGYSVAAGTITFTPSASVPAGLLQASGSRTISVLASNHTASDVTQAISAGAATQIAVTTQPTAPATNGALLATQPVVVLRDQYNNAATGTAPITASVGSGTWTLGGTTTVAATSGTATFTDLTASSATSVTGATILFSSGTLTSATSSAFNIPVPPPANDNPAGAVTLSPNSAVVSGSLAGSSPLSPSVRKDVWFKFVAVGPSATVTINNFAPTGNKDLYLYSSLPVTYSTTTDVVGSGVTTSSTTESATATGLTAGNTYYILVQDVAGTGDTFDIAVANAPSAPSVAAATSVTSTGFTANWSPLTGASGYRVDVYKPGTATTEPFTGIAGGTSTSYLTRTWTGAGGISWSAFKSRTDQVVDAGNAAITLQDAAAAYLESGSINGDAGQVSFDVKQVFTGTGGILTVKILSGATFTTETIVGTIAYTTTKQTFSGSTAGITGPYKIRVENNTAARPAIDNLSFEIGRTGLSGFTNADAATATSLAITGASPNTLYRYVVRATNGTATSANSAEQAVTTLDAAPLVTTGTTGSLTRVSAAITGSTMSTTGSAITERGVAYGTSTDPTTAGTKVVVSGTTGSFDAGLTGLTPGKAYFARAYAINGAGTTYGDNVTFTTTANTLPTFSGITVSTTTAVALPITTASVIANASDSDGDTVTVTAASATSANGGTVSLAGSTLTYTSAAAFTGSDSFTVTLSDGFGTTSATINVTVSGSVEDPLFTNPSNNIVLSDLSGGVKHLAFTGLAGRTYGIQRSTNLSSWTQIGTTTATTGGAASFDDPSPPAGSAFYRIVYPAAP